MFTKKFLIVLLLAAVLLTACAPKAPDEPITLRMGIPDGDNVHYAPYVLEFIEQAKTLSGGTVTIEPVWEAGDSTSTGYEAGVIQLVKDGTLDLGLAASRSFSGEGITSFQALQAPFLIDNDALAEAVATSDTASEMLENLASAGLTGLTLWPEDLRHPFSMDPANPLLSPEDFQGITVRVTDHGVSDLLVKALGGNPIFEASDYQGAEAGLLQGRSLTGRPAATGNVTFFAKYQVLFANAAAFDQLSDAQRSVLQEAAAAAQKKALADRPGDVAAGVEWCAAGGTVVLASDEQVAAFQAAGQPVTDKLEENAFNAETIAAIRDLKAKTQPSPYAEACSSTAVSPQGSSEDQTWSTGLPPNGTWQVTLTNDDVINMGVLKSNAPDWSGIYVFKFQDGVFHWTWEGTEGYGKGQTAAADGTYAVVDDFVRLTSGNVVDDIQWRLDDDGLHFHLLATQNDPFTEIRAMLESRPYQEIDE